MVFKIVSVYIIYLNIKGLNDNLFRKGWMLRYYCHWKS